MVAFIGDIEEFAYLIVCDFIRVCYVFFCVYNDVISVVCCWEYDGFIEFKFGVYVLWEGVLVDGSDFGSCLISAEL